MIDHVSLPVSDLARSEAFYDAILGTLGLHQGMRFEAGGTTVIGYGGEEGLPVWIGGPTEEAGAVTPLPGHHLAFRAPDRETVQAFHAAGLSSGGTDNGAPGPRPEYGPEYYAAFVLDPDGHHLEVVAYVAAEEG